MVDLIDRQAAIDALEKVAEFFPWKVPGNRDSYDRYNEAWNDAMGRAEIEIENLPSAQPGWIPCELVNQCFIPQLEDCGMISILVTCERGTVRKKRVVKVVSVYHGRVQSKENRIIAFMHLPEPWKGGQE